ncbi:MAG TPA: beta-1,6-N-acetylglucosaminyltransferase [Acidobacteriaceae bacterium]|nr:beta-1,6-N-acetylglucosaminyltransferase [Acidobacteriaceae bacterium]
MAATVVNSINASETTAPRVAFLILAHNEPQLLSRLLRKLVADWCHCFVHIDRKVDIKQFQDLSSVPHVTFLPMEQRLAVYWCGYSVTAAMLNLMRYAKTSAFQPTRFVLLSGVDYPIKPLNLIRTVVSQNKEYIQIDRQIQPRGDSSFDRCLNRRFLGNNRFLNPRTAPQWIDRITRGIERRMARSHPEGLKIYYGAQWWTLTDHGIEAVLSFVKSNPVVVRWFTGTKVPDEHMIHSIIKASSRSSQVAFDATRTDEPPFGINRHALHYIDWTTANPHLPKTLELEDLNPLLESDALFARKMSSSRSVKLLDALDAAFPD